MALFWFGAIFGNVQGLATPGSVLSNDSLRCSGDHILVSTLSVVSDRILLYPRIDQGKELISGTVENTRY